MNESDELGITPMEMPSGVEGINIGIRSTQWNFGTAEKRVDYFDLLSPDEPVELKPKMSFEQRMKEMYENYKSAPGKIQSTIEGLNPPQDKEYTWETEYNQISKGRRGKSMPKPKSVNFRRKDFYTLEECLKAYRELTEKEIGDICLTGSLALLLQNVIKRTRFNDMDVIIVGNYQLDDDIMPYQKDNNYPEDPNLGELSNLVYSNIPIDLFKFNKDYSVQKVVITYKGNEYICQDYRDIIKAKMQMVLPRMKDYSDIAKHFSIEFK
jgi:hypothetical protein